MADLYNRQSDLDLNIPEKVTVIGLGGIGSWVAMNLGLIGVKHLNLIDYDIIEEHNLNRTIFREIDIDTKKIEAISDLLSDRRSDLTVRIFDKRLEDLTRLELTELKDTLIIDCRDVLDVFPDSLSECQKIKLGYDGLSITIIINPDYSTIWELNDDRGYQVTPSFLPPCQFLASAITTLITDPKFDISLVQNKAVTLNIDKMFRDLIGDINE